jgi:transcriptional regulator GlxA family with amidase domain
MRNVAFVAYPGYSMMALAAVPVFEIANFYAANESSAEPAYDIRFVSEMGGKIKTSVGVGIDTEPFSDMHFDTLIVGGATLVVDGVPSPKPATRGMLDFLKDATKRYRRIASICTGAFVLAEAGLLDGRRCTTHWYFAQNLQTRFPLVNMHEDRIFVNDGPIWTSAGNVAGIDLCLALVENDLGAEIAKSVARNLVVYHRRGGGQSQFSSLIEMTAKSDRIQTALTYARDHLHESLAVADLAQVANLSLRQFNRVFHAETGQSPAKAIENLRVEAARTLMEHSRHSIEAVARQAGFSDRDQMRRAFVRAFGQSPQTIRRNARLGMLNDPDSAEGENECSELC